MRIPAFARAGPAESAAARVVMMWCVSGVVVGGGGCGCGCSEAGLDAWKELSCVSFAPGGIGGGEGILTFITISMGISNTSLFTVQQ